MIPSIIEKNNRSDLGSVIRILSKAEETASDLRPLLNSERKYILYKYMTIINTVAETLEDYFIRCR